jgi:alkanesulfonate monooxygenase SsuD/methylene tetrahydromethanopterin reductase-like flavin-dependent oxidoreductase (luciferase family)
VVYLLMPDDVHTTLTADVSAHRLRFGVVTPVTQDLAAWRDQVRRLADTGYSTILMPDVPEWQPAPGPVLAAIATMTDVRVGTWVYASPVRPARMTAWEAHTLSVLTDGRFELGIGTGRPGIAEQLRTLGIPTTAAGQRIDEVRDTVTALRELDGTGTHTPVVMAAGGPRALALAAEVADTVNFVMPQIESRADTLQRVRAFDNRRNLELALHVNVIGDAVAPFMAGPDTDPDAVRAADSVAYLPADPVAAAEEVHRRHQELGFSYFVVGADVAQPLAPMVARLSTR